MFSNKNILSRLRNYSNHLNLKSINIRTINYSSKLLGTLSKNTTISYGNASIILCLAVLFNSSSIGSNNHVINCDSNDEIKTNKIQIYQYLICPFCNRVKSYLDYSNIDYEVIEVNPLTKSEINFPVKSKKVPIAIINGNVIEDSSNIITEIRKLNPSSSLLFTEDTDQWLEWSEKKLAVMLYPNITRSFKESWECFGYAENVKTWNLFSRYLVRTSGPLFMSLANSKIKKKYNIIDERKELHEILQVWCNALNGKKYLHGDSITMPDLLVFGVLKSIEGLQTFNEIMLESIILKTWYDHVNKSLKK